MTTVAWDGKTLACDSRMTLGGTIVSDKTPKLYKNIGPFWALGFSGNVQQAVAGIEKLSTLGLEEILNIEEGFLSECTLLCITYTGVCYLLNPAGCSHLPDHWAIGSGEDWAISAMDHDKDAVDAVKFAASRDIYTNTKVTKLTWVPKENK